MPKPAPDMGGDAAGDWRRDASEQFTFGAREFDPVSGQIRLGYELDGIPLTETFDLPPRSQPLPTANLEALSAALDLLHWVAGISYWKAGCPNNIIFSRHPPDAWQADWLGRLYREGLAEFAWHNGLDPDAFAAFPAVSGPASAPVSVCLDQKALVPMGGGKDSLVALERLRRAGQPLSTIQIGSSALIRQVAERAGAEHRVISRTLDPALAELNRAGAWNGHVPITAIHAAVLLVAALYLGYDRVVFANERSADEPALIDAAGRPVNHQFSKSYVFECMLAAWIGRYIGAQPEVFSILRRDRELAICREFAALERYHDVFSSCNRNFHLDGARTQRWCGQCPKCHFVFLALATFLSPAAVTSIFGRNLLDDPAQTDGFRALLGLDGAKPFECVGEIAEARAALGALIESEQWCRCAVVESLADAVAGVEIPELDALCRPAGEHRIPDEILASA